MDATWQRVRVRFSAAVFEILVSIGNVDRLRDQNAWSFYGVGAKNRYPMRIAQQPMREPIITGPVAVALHQPFWGRRCQIILAGETDGGHMISCDILSLVRKIDKFFLLEVGA